VEQSADPVGDDVGRTGSDAGAQRRAVVAGCEGVESDPLPPILRGRVLTARRFTPDAYGFDYHDKSIEGARATAAKEGLEVRLNFGVAKAKEFPGKDYDLITVFDCLHDMGDPVGAAVHVRNSLSKDGTWMIVEPFANDELKDNLNPVGRVYYSFSTLLCTPCSRAQEVAPCLGAQSGEKRIREVVTAFENPSLMIPDKINLVELSLTQDKLVLTMEDRSGSIWMMDNVDR
jgi:hypothetical protein